MKVAVLGATGSTGSLVIDKLLANGHEVVAVSRSPAPPRSFAARFSSEVGDLTDSIFLGAALADCDAVISCLGQNRKSKSLFSKPTSPPNILQTVARITLEAIGGRHVRFIYLSAFGVGEDMKHHALLFRIILRLSSIHVAYLDHAEAERLIKASAQEWTIVKPPGLTDLDKEVPLRDRGDEWSSFESVTKKSLAGYLVGCLDDPSTVRKSITVGKFLEAS